MAYAISDDFRFTPSSVKDGIMRGVVEQGSTTGKLSEEKIRRFRKRVQYYKKLQENRSRGG